MQAAIKICLISFFTLLITGCAWYKEPSLMPNANASLDGFSLNESSRPGFISTLKSADNYGASDTGFADGGGNYVVLGFDNS